MTDYGQWQPHSHELSAERLIEAFVNHKRQHGGIARKDCPACQKLRTQIASREAE